MENETKEWFLDYLYIKEHFGDMREKEENMTRKFWMITGDGNSPKVRHITYRDAVLEAERLAKANPGIEFFVLESVELVSVPASVVRQKL
jgi:hypothetical protein